MTQTTNKKCEGCGGEITPDQIVHRQAGLVGGVLLCPQCVDKKRRELLDARNAALRAQQTTPAAAAGAGEAPVGTMQGEVYFPPVKEGKDETDETLSLIGDDEASTGSSKIRSFAEASTLAGAHHEENLKRPLTGPDEAATRVRTFHGKLTEAGLAHMDEQINEWIDSHPGVFVKHSNSTVGVFEGKNKEPHLLVTLFY